MKFTQSITTCLAALLVCGNLAAQDSGFDLSSQRSEKQYVTNIPGQKIDHKGIVINPTPQAMQIMQKDMWVSVERGFNVKDKTGKTPSEWIADMTIVNAKLLLEQSGMSIKEIAAELNFPEQFTFRKFFKLHVGVPPKEYRLRNRVK